LTAERFRHCFAAQTEETNHAKSQKKTNKEAKKPKKDAKKPAAAKASAPAKKSK